MDQMAQLERDIDEIYKQQVIFEVPVECFVEKYVEIEKEIV
jgi:hypothetical protein